MNQNDTIRRLRVAVPYYGLLSRPCVGLERLFFAVDLQDDGKQHSSMIIWNPQQEPDLTVWLSKNGVSGVICSDDYPLYEQEFQQQGIFVACGQKGEVSEVVDRWQQSVSEHTKLEKVEPDESCDYRLGPHS